MRLGKHYAAITPNGARGWWTWLAPRAMGWDEQDELFSHALTMAMRPAEDTGVNATVRLPELG